MAEGAPASLQDLWKTGRHGNLSPLEQLKVVAYRDVYEDLGQAVEYTKIGEKVTKIGGGYPSGEAIRRFLQRVDDDAEWYPGKSYQEKRGPAPALNGTKRQIVAASVMADKKAGVEPTYRTTIAKCPKATLNPATGKPVSKKVIYNRKLSDKSVATHRF